MLYKLFFNLSIRILFLAFLVVKVHYKNSYFLFFRPILGRKLGGFICFFRATGWFLMLWGIQLLIFLKEPFKPFHVGIVLDT